MGKWSNLWNKKDDETRPSMDETRQVRGQWVTPYPQQDQATPEPQVQQPQEPEIEAPRITNVYWTPSQILQEQQDRLNPQYESPLKNISDDEFNSIANFVQKEKDVHPDMWANGDPGWASDDSIYNNRVAQWDVPETWQSQQSEMITAPEIKEQTEPVPETTDRATISSRTGTDVYHPTETSEDIYKKVLQNHPELNIDESKASYQSLQTSGKINWNLMPSVAGTDVENAPTSSKYTQQIITSAMSASGPAGIAKILVGLAGGPASWAYWITYGGTAGYNYAKSQGWIEGNKTVDWIVEHSDFLDEWGQKKQGKWAYNLYKENGGDITDPKQFFQNLAYIFKNPGKIITSDRLNEYNSTVTDVVTSLTANMGANVIGLQGQGASRAIRNLLSGLTDENPLYLEKGQVTRNNLGLEGVFELDDELIGGAAVEYWLNFGQELYDAGITDPELLEYYINKEVARVYGDLSNYSEFVEHEMGDLGNTVEAMTPRAVEGYAKITHDKNLETAANSQVGNLAMDLAGQIPGGQGLIETIGRMVGKEVRASGGIDEVFTNWDIANKATPISELTTRDKNFSHITKEGTVGRGEFEPNTNPNAVKNPFAKGATWLVNLFKPTNQWKAQYEGNAIFDYVDLGVSEALEPRSDDEANSALGRVKEFINNLENPEKIPENSPMSTTSQSAVFNSVKDDVAIAVRQKHDEINMYIDRYENNENNRVALNKLAEALGITPARVLDMYENQKTVLTQMIINKANENGGTIPGIDIPVESRDFGMEVIQMIKPFTGRNPDAWNTNQLMVQITTSIGDGVADVVVGKYQIQPDGFIFRFGDMIKKMQNILLLGLSPSYLANNFTNNLVTRSALGYGGYMSANAINTFMDRFGYRPERLKETFMQTFAEADETDENSTNAERLQARLRSEKQKTKGTGIKKGVAEAMKKVGDVSANISNKAGIFGSISGEVESSESQQIVTSAMMTYLARTWKPGVNFRKMPVALENAIEAKMPGMVKTIYNAISAGVNMKEIEDALFGSFIAPSVQDTLLQSAKALGFNNSEDIVTEYFAKNGMLQKLETALRGKRGEDVDKIMEDFKKHLKKQMAVEFSTTLANTAAAIAINTTNEGFSEAIRCGIEAVDEMTDIWLNSIDIHEDIFEQKVRDKMSADEFHKAYEQQQKDLTDRWKNVYAKAQQTFLGVLRGLGVDDEFSQKYVDLFAKKNELWAEFFEKTQPELFNKYREKSKWRTTGKKPDSLEKWYSRTRWALNKYRQDCDAIVADIRDKEMKMQVDADNAYLEGLKGALGDTKASEVDAKLAPIFEEIRNKRLEIIAQTEAIREIARKSRTDVEQNQKWQEGNAKREELINQYREIQKKLYDTIAEFNPYTADTKQNPSTDLDTEASVRIDINEAQAEETEKISKAIDEMATDAIDKGETPDISSNPEEWKEDLRRNNLRDIAKRAGATEEQADAYARYVGAVAKAWENNHKGKDFFKDALGVQVEFINQNRTNTDNVYHQEQQVADAGVDWAKVYQLPEYIVNAIDDAILDKNGELIEDNVYIIRDVYKVAFDTLHFKFVDKMSDLADLITKETDIAYDDAYNFVTSMMQTFTTDEYFGTPNESDKYVIATISEKFGDDINELSDEYNDTFENLNDAFGFSEYYDLETKNDLQKIAIRAGASHEVAEAFSWFMAMIAAGWEKNNPGKKFFTDAPGISGQGYGLSYRITENRNYDDIYRNGEYDLNDTITLYKNGDFLTLAHEMAHGFQYTLNEQQERDLATYFGWTYEEYIRLRDLALNKDFASKEDLVKWYDGSEIFVRGFLGYMGMNVAPTPGMRNIFQKFYDFIKGLVGRNKNYFKQKLHYNPETYYKYNVKHYFTQQIVRPDTVINGVSLRQIFDSMINIDEAERLHSEGLFQKSPEQRIKGQFRIEDGQKIVSLFKGSDFSTLVHETMGHGFTTTLNDSQQEALAAYNGWTLAKYKQLENNWYYSPDTMSETDRQAWVDAQERFAYGFEQYLMEGKSPNSAMAQVFEAFKNFLLEIYKGIRHLIYNGEEIDIHKEQHGVTLAQIFDSMLDGYQGQEQTQFNIDSKGLKDIEPNSYQYLLGDYNDVIEKRNALKQAAEKKLTDDVAEYVSDIEQEYKLTIDESMELVVEIMHGLGLNPEKEESDYFKHTLDQKMGAKRNTDVYEFINSHREDAVRISDDAVEKYMQDIWNDQENFPQWKALYAYNQVEQQKPATNVTKLEDTDLKGLPLTKGETPGEEPTHAEIVKDVPKDGDYVVPLRAFEYGKHTIVGAIVRNGRVTAYVPQDMQVTEVKVRNKAYRVIGVSTRNPELVRYMYGDQIKTQKVRKSTGTNKYKPEMAQNTTPPLDPVAEAHNQMGYEQILPIIDKFRDMYKQSVDDSMTNYKFDKLDNDTKAQVRKYIDQDIRTDLANTKYKTGKVGEMMRDAALLNYSKQYGFDNYLTLLCPYQFWQTRSFFNWMNRMGFGSKGRKMWKRYARLKELERKNEKEFMPSKISGKFGLYIPGLPDWMGDALFMSTDQLLPVSQFIDPFIETKETENAVIATAEKYLQEDYEDKNISWEQYQSAMNRETRKDNPDWQNALARAQLVEGSDGSFTDLTKKFFGLSLPLSIAKALATGDNTEWNQWPITRTGTAFRAIVGDNWIGKTGEAILSAPEKALRTAAAKAYGNQFEYNEFGAFGDYYIRNHVFDMVYEGKISPPEAVKACAEKDGNPIWEEAANRQREEILVKMQGGSVIDAVKKLVEDKKKGKDEEIKDDYFYVLASLLTVPMNKNVVHESEKQWREEKAGLQDAFAEGTATQYYDEHPNLTYNNLRYESDSEQMLRQYLYKKIMDIWYSLDNASQEQIRMSFGPDFEEGVLQKETRAIETMNLDKLAGYAQAMNGKIPFVATDSFTVTPESFGIMEVPQEEKDAYNLYLEEREKNWKGYAEINNIYYSLPPEDRELFIQANPKLDEYQKWNSEYRKEHEDADRFIKRKTDYYNMKEAEKVCASLDDLTMKYLKISAFSDQDVPNEFKPILEQAWAGSGSNKSYDKFIENLKNYILGK